MKAAGVYLIRIGPWFYVGSSGNIGSRFAEHRRMCREKCHDNAKVQVAFGKHGTIELEVLEPVDVSGFLTAKERRDALRAAEQRHLDRFFGDQWLCNRSRNSRGPHARPDMVAKWQDPYAREQMLARIKELGSRSPGEETRKKMAEAKRGARNVRARPVITIDPLGNQSRYDTATAAAKAVGVTQQAMDLWLRGKMALPGQGARIPKKNAHLIGWTFRYAENS
jgi:hypothetical protein